jgi:hypothetical protein
LLLGAAGDRCTPRQLCIGHHTQGIEALVQGKHPTAMEESHSTKAHSISEHADRLDRQDLLHDDHPSVCDVNAE